MRVLLLVLVVATLLSGCSTTPGDAARGSGHPEQAAELYRKGAEQGDPVAAFKLASMVEGGKVAAAQYGSAGSWYNKACLLGDTVGCHNAGVGYEYGNLGLEKDYEKARTSYQRAAERGYMQSQYNLGSLYSNLYFTNDVEGLRWLLASQAKAQECSSKPLCKWILEDPPGHIEVLRARMSPEQVREAESRTVQAK